MNENKSWLSCAEPQGSVPGPLLFVLHTQDYLQVALVLYADDRPVMDPNFPTFLRSPYFSYFLTIV
jgi:hypothetical protein